MYTGTILIVDDEEQIRGIIHGMLEVNNDYRLLTASNGREALDVCAREEIDLVFTDLRMPVMDGLAFLRELRNRGSEIPVVIISGYGEREDVITALRLGASNFLLKPNEVKMVLSLADRILRVRQKDILKQKVYNYFVKETQTYRIPTNLQYTLPLIDIITDKVVQVGVCDQTDLMNLRIALDEALVNAIVHGNLEISSKEKGNSLQDLIHFNEMVREKSRTEPYCNKRVEVTLSLTPEEARFEVADEGPGFDWRNLPTSFEDVSLLSNHGRGLILIHTFMNRIEFNGKGNRIVMVKRRNGAPAAPAGPA